MKLLKYYLKEQFEGFDLKEAFLFGASVGMMIVFLVIMSLVLK